MASDQEPDDNSTAQGYTNLHEVDMLEQPNSDPRQPREFAPRAQSRDSNRQRLEHRSAPRSRNSIIPSAPDIQPSASTSHPMEGVEIDVQGHRVDEVTAIIQGLGWSAENSNGMAGGQLGQPGRPVNGICFWCGRRGHQMSRCPGPPGPNGYIPGCPQCYGDRTHSLATCPKGCTARDAYHYLIRLRACKPPIEHDRDLLSGQFRLENGKFIGPTGSVNNPPWSAEFSKQMAARFKRAWQWTENGMFEDPSWNGDLASLEPQISPNAPRPPRSDPKTGDVPMPDRKPAFVKNQEQMQREAEARERKANGLGHGHGKKRKGASGYTQPAKKRIASSTTQRQVLVPMEVIERLNNQSKTIYELVRRQGTLPASPDSKPPTEDKGRSRERHSRDNQPQPGSSELSNRDPPRRSTDTSQQNSRGPPRRRSRDTDRPSYEDHHDSHCTSSNPQPPQRHFQIRGRADERSMPPPIRGRSETNGHRVTGNLVPIGNRTSNPGEDSCDNCGAQDHHWRACPYPCGNCGSHRHLREFCSKEPQFRK